MISDKWYYFDSKGHMLLNQWVGDYTSAKDGDMLKSTVTLNNYGWKEAENGTKGFQELAEKAIYINLTDQYL